MLRRVLAEVFGDNIEVEYSYDPKSMGHRALLTSVDDKPTQLGFHVTHDWCSVWILDLEPDVSMTDFDYDYEEEPKAANLRALARVLHAYVNGEGRIEYRPTLIRRRLQPHFVVEIDGGVWSLGHHFSRRPV
ncbi:hypothetical protein [Aeromicrobium marinum]|nr:hypothetical protein [Aeromicrobium marinum]